MVDESIPSEGRICTQCGKWKAWSAFSPHAHGLCGKQSRCKECGNAAHKVRYHIDIEKSRKRSREATRKSHLKNPQKRNAQRRAWERRNPAKMAAIRASWEERHPAELSAAKTRAARQRRARKARAQGAHTEAEWQDLVKRSRGRCVKCKRRQKLTRDHIIPITKGGGDEITNIQPLCRSCNSAKRDKILHLL
jgi:5-methylcytosine-specific restriction endonuclease McrA